MQQRRVRLGDILDDYCPRERRITNHIVLAMIDDQVKQTRCATCDSDHDYKQARIPPQRRKRPDEGAAADSVDAALRPRAAAGEDAGPKESSEPDIQPQDARELPPSSEDAPAGTSPELEAASADDDGPVHRRLIRATLPRPEGQVPDRKGPDFTVRQPGSMRGRDFDGQVDGNRPGRRPMRPHGGSPTSRFGGPRHGSGQGPRHGSGGFGSGSGQGQGPQGNRPGHPGGPRGNRPGSGAGRGGRKRGR